MPSSSSSRFVLSLFLFAIGLGLGYYISTDIRQSPSTYEEVRANSSSYQFINPLLQCDQGQEYISAVKGQPSKSDIEDIITSQKATGKINFVSVYYRDLNNGPWIGIKESEKFFPASLMKVPVMLFFLKKSESDPTLLSKKVDGKNVPQLISFDPHFPPEQSIDPAKTYDVEELIISMIKYSDNKAANNLLSIMGPYDLNSVLQSLYIDIPQNVTTDYITVRNYATFFRVLFNASYLNQTDSEKALKLLSESTFDQGLMKYLPANMVVAHKFGEREVDNMPGQNQLHDCGIVYYPKQPYLLCVMTRGSDMDAMTDTIGLISQAVYKAIDEK